MGPSDSSPVATSGNAEQGSHFMTLPTEIREMIYRPLLGAKYTMTEHSMTTKEYDSNRRNIQNGPDYTYQFHTAILGTNRKVHQEARDLCWRENNFICLTSQQPSRLGYELCKRGLQTIAKGSKARGFWNTSMTITLDPTSLRGWPEGGSYYCRTNGWVDASEDGRPWSYIFFSDELPEFCSILLEMSRVDDSILCKTVLYLDFNAAIGNGEANEIDTYPAGRARLRKVTGPLHHLHSLGAAQIDGPLTGSYKGEIISSVRKHCPTAIEIIHTTIVSIKQADEQASKGQLLQANLGYKAALSFVRSCCWRYNERDFVMNRGPFPGLTANQNIGNIVVRLQARIAAVYFENGQLRMARIYTERALDPRRGYDGRGNKLYDLSIEPWQGPVYAEVLHVAAKISYTHGDVHEARNDLRDAGQLVPFDEEQQSRYEAWQIHSDSLLSREAKRDKARELHREKQNEKFEGLFLAAYNWQSKGDQLLRSGRSDLASSKYKSTLLRMDLIDQEVDRNFTLNSGAFTDYRIVDATKALRFKVQASVAAAFLMSRMYKEVIESTDVALTCSYTYCDCKDVYSNNHCRVYGSGDRNWVEKHKLDRLRIHYCKALALNHMGDTVHAVENMERALVFDPGDGTVFAQLVLLKRRLEEENARKPSVEIQTLGKIESERSW